MQAKADYQQKLGVYNVALAKYQQDTEQYNKDATNYAEVRDLLLNSSRFAFEIALPTLPCVDPGP